MADEIVLRVPKEIVVKVVDDVEVSDPKVGQTGTFDDELYDETGAQIGTSHGSFRIEYVRPGDGGLLTYYTEDITLRDGTIHAEGWADFNDVRTSEWVYYPATGTGGRYAGLTGFRKWRMTGVRASAEARILLSD
ncbi:allene oxide cyclase barrel-like domain-containing protein [Streptomyces sp. NPDC002092]